MKWLFNATTEYLKRLQWFFWTVHTGFAWIEYRSVNRRAKMITIFSRIIWMSLEQCNCPQKNLELNTFLLKLSHFSYMYKSTNLEEVMAGNSSILSCQTLLFFVAFNSLVLKAYGSLTVCLSSFCVASSKCMYKYKL